MLTSMAVWLLMVAGTAIVIADDMRRLAVNRVWLSRVGWMTASMCAGPVAGIAYLAFRRATRQELFDSAWRIVGDSACSINLRRKRLVALRQAGLIGAPIFRACLRELEAARPALPDTNSIE
ncbi:hypothetical protein [Burkholderia ubonensis]|uniref:hypothetical protein n=1 Tax=Burkholderia ubonensis TaxID=101571 RepID=UPI0021086F75|nr:hypothetical protein [Burkholderia ubonensis]